MHLEYQKPDTPIFINHYQSSKIIIANHTFYNSVIITSHNIIDNNWNIPSACDLTLNSIKPLLEIDSHIYLLGTGPTFFVPSKEIISCFFQLGKSIDFMDSSAACRTFNILANEKRKIVAGIIV